MKVVFTGPNGLLMKDLDEEILANTNDSSILHLRRITTKVITKPRSRGITEVNDLLAVLGPRHTSWPKDIAIISGLPVIYDVYS